MKHFFCCTLALVLICGPARAADDPQLAGKWKLDREATLELFRESGGTADDLPDFDFELELRDDGNARFTTQVAGSQSGKRAQWKVVSYDDEGHGTLELVPTVGTAKRHEFRLPGGDVLHLRAQDAKHTLVLRRAAAP